MEKEQVRKMVQALCEHYGWTCHYLKHTFERLSIYIIMPDYKSHEIRVSTDDVWARIEHQDLPAPGICLASRADSIVRTIFDMVNDVELQRLEAKGLIRGPQINREPAGSDRSPD